MARLTTNAIVERRRNAVEELDRLFDSMSGSRRLAAAELSQYKNHSFGVGWLISKTLSDGVARPLHVLLPETFPYSAPRIAISGGPHKMEFPHLEPQGLLCLTPPDCAVDIEHPTDVLESLMDDSIQLIEDGIQNLNQDDFRDEFLSYWDIAVVNELCRWPPFISIIEPRGPSRCISVWGSNVCVFGESDDSVSRWLDNRGVDVGEHGFRSGLMIWLPEPLVPAEYPNDGRELLSMIRSLESIEAEKITRYWDSIAVNLFVIIGFPSRFGVCFAGLALEAPKDANCLVRGFRPSKVPPKELLDRYIRNSKSLVKAKVNRADPSWIHGRDQDNHHGNLRQRRVAIVGCGSVGGQLARMLSQAGVGHLLLIDDDTLDWPNTVRHCLGARSVGLSKAEGLAKEIKTSFPHIGAVSARAGKVVPTAEELMQELEEYDLLVSTTGNWAAESFLNDWQRTTDPAPPILYGWVESHALAAHAVRIDARGACFRCGVNGNGVPDSRVIEWPETDAGLQEPRCGASYSPYGPCELAFAHALIAQAVIDSLVQQVSGPMHRIWVADPARIMDAGGRLRDGVGKQFDQRFLKGGIIESEWSPDAECPVCMVRSR